MNEKHFCINCQKEIDSDSQFCPFCGAQAQITKEESNQTSVNNLSEEKFKRKKVFLTIGVVLFIFFSYLFYSVFLKSDTLEQSLNIKIADSHQDLNHPSDVFRKEIVNCPGSSTEYSILIRKDKLNKKFISLSHHSRIFRTLDYRFSNSTRIYKFKAVCEKSTIRYIFFKADDPIWFVKYLWNIKTNKLFYLARKTGSSKIYNSKNLKSNSKMEKLIKNFY